MTTYNVLIEKTADAEKLTSALTAAGATVNAVYLKLHVLNVTAPNTDFATVPGVISFEEDIVLNLVEQTTWANRRICSLTTPMMNLYTPMNMGDGAVVYVVDTGVKRDHSEFDDVQSQIIDLYSFDGTFTDTTGHGTSMTSLIVGKTLGVSPKAIVKTVKIPVGSVVISALLDAFNAILEDHLQSETTVKVVNCSWVIPKSQLLDSKIAELQSHNLVVVAAAGNTISDANNFSPVGLDTVLGVAASDAYDRVIAWGENAGSNWGAEVDITAPGIDVPVATLAGTIEDASGTSVAAAIVSGAVLQYIAERASLTAADIQDLVLTSAKTDILFRNETVYGTTPNRFLYLTPKNQLLYPSATAFKSGDTTTFEIETLGEFDNLEFCDFLSTPVVPASWISVIKTGAKTYNVTVTPPFANAGRYLVYGLLYKENTFISIPITLKVYINDIIEVQGTTYELYVRKSETQSDLTVLTLSVDTCLVTGCGKGEFCGAVTSNNANQGCCYCTTDAPYGCAAETFTGPCE